jgi:hypothetical protein
MFLESAMNRTETSPYRELLPGVVLAIGCGVVYFVSRPPLYHNDGYRDRLYAIQPYWFYNANPHHLLWIFVQALIGRVAAWLGYPTTIPFQAVGIALNCLTIFFFFALLRRISASTIFAASGALLIAFSPNFWQFGLENRPYSLLFMNLVLYLWLWYPGDSNLLPGWRLFAAGVLLLILALLQQGAILLIPAAVIVLVVHSTDRPRGLISASAWGASVAATVALLYVIVWALTKRNEAFSHWVAGFAVYVHPPNVFNTAIWLSAIQSVMGIFGALLQPSEIITLLSQTFSANMILAVYGVAGILTCLTIGSTTWWRRLDRPLLQLIRNSPLFALSLLSILFWSAFVFAWQPGSSEYWVLTLFPALICFGMLVRETSGRWLWVFAAVVVIISAWNIHFNRGNDRDLSVNFPEPLLAAINQHVGRRDIFIGLVQDGGIGGVDYDLLFTCLQYAPRNPGLRIMEDFVWPAHNSPSWRDQLRARINGTLASGGRVFVAGHVLDPATYNNLSGKNDPFAPFIQERYTGTEGAAFYQEVREALAPYKLKQSDFSVGPDRYSLLERN